ncbi:MAG TPA: serine/threonine-protein kinase [Polyangiaceae bacterium]|nr:serine/threonine-protein kinase [Polyangiaceae bacterium]
MPVAAGGMAMVWAARLKGTRGFQKIVAVKTMLPKLSEEVQFEQMFLDEASLASQIRHPHVVEILDLGEQDGVLFLVMEWIDGMPLNQLMKAAKIAGGMPLPIATRIVMQACAGLHAAHELRDSKGQLVGLVHRDVSPQNILVTYDGVTKVVDFGVAKATAHGGGSTSAGQIKGKVGYMAPEQIEGEEAMDRRADIFAMGIVLYALTTGKHPFRRESDAATMYNICSPAPAVPPRKFLPNYPESLERVLLKSLAKSPSDRYETANDMLRDLDQALPANQRVITDEEVAHFVRKLVGDKLQERRATLSDALMRADSLAPLRDADLSSATGSVSHGGVMSQSLLPPPPPDNATTTELSGLGYGRKRTLLIGGVAVALGAAALAITLMSRTPEPVSAPAAATPLPTAVPVLVAPPTPPQTPTPSPATSADKPAPAPTETKAGTKPLQQGGGKKPGPGGKPTQPPVTAPVKPPPPQNDWRQNPGF